MQEQSVQNQYYNNIPNNQPQMNQPNNQYNNNIPNNLYKNNVPNNQYYNNIPNNLYYNNVPNNQPVINQPNNQYYNNVPNNLYYNNVPNNQPVINQQNNQYSNNIPNNQPNVPLRVQVNNKNLDIPFNKNDYYSFDPQDQLVGVYTNIDKIHDNGANQPLSDNPMDPNWGGNEYTLQQVNSGKYQGNEIYRPNLFNISTTNFDPKTFQFDPDSKILNETLV
jgi:hypothetical protein